MNCGTRGAALWYVDSVGWPAGSATSEMQLSVVPTKPPWPVLLPMLVPTLCAAEASFLKRDEPPPELAVGWCCCCCCCDTGGGGFSRGPSSKQKVSPQISKILPPSEVERPWSRGKLRPLAAQGRPCQSSVQTGHCIHPSPG